MKSTESQSLFSPQELFEPDRLNVNSLLALVPYIPAFPERGYVGTDNDRRKFVEMCKVCRIRPAYLVRLVERYPLYHSFYLLMTNSNSFQHVRDKIKFDYSHKKYIPEIVFIAQLMPL
jgi:hypothetical protein